MIHDLDGPLNNGTSFNNIDPMKKGEFCYPRLAEPDGSGGTCFYSTKITYVDVLTGSDLYVRFPDVNDLNGPPPPKMVYVALKLRFENLKDPRHGGTLPLRSGQFCYVSGDFEMHGSRSLKLSSEGLVFRDLAQGEQTEGYVLLLIGVNDPSPFMMYNDVLWFQIK